jgi:hypothetical protein
MPILKVSVLARAAPDKSNKKLSNHDSKWSQRMRGGTMAIALAVSTIVPLAVAENYEITVTRKGANLYKVDGKEIFIRTKYCYEYAYSETAILDAYGTAGDLKFPESGSECTVKAVFGKSKQNAGKYVVQVSQDNDDWYEVFGQGIYIHTNSCLSIAMNEDAILDLSPGGYGSLQIDGEHCTVEGVYSKLKL